MLEFSIPSPRAYKSKQDYVYQVLRGAIMKCELNPGQKLIIKEIADLLSVSAIPVREALRLLHSEDLVEYNAHTGAVVSPISPESIVETFMLKEALEVVSIKVAIQKVTADALEKLKGQLEKMNELIRTENYKLWGHLNTEFHMLITDIADMPLLEEMLLRVLDKWERIRNYFFSELLMHRHAQSQNEHIAIVTAIEKGDIKEAEQLIKQHNQKALDYYMEHIQLDD
ncbi:GntR family transcriptional regulator [Pullulanibacillus pueri]|uniref:GntR family transcriptional regulator n=1 Tax=Pullulanibacillus pueri TaxID=1437324 RepID=A0A8J2ZVZ4_9BACL|nr:GntR family transcriptional regulator [Pullulanibacillus pueri]